MRMKLTSASIAVVHRLATPSIALALSHDLYITRMDPATSFPSIVGEAYTGLGQPAVAAQSTHPPLPLLL
jgi:hypothetical protein